MFKQILNNHRTGHLIRILMLTTIFSLLVVPIYISKTALPSLETLTGVSRLKDIQLVLSRHMQYIVWLIFMLAFPICIFIFILVQTTKIGQTSIELERRPPADVDLDDESPGKGFLYIILFASLPIGLDITISILLAFWLWVVFIYLFILSLTTPPQNVNILLFLLYYLCCLSCSLTLIFSWNLLGKQDRFFSRKRSKVYTTLMGFAFGVSLFSIFVFYNGASEGAIIARSLATPTVFPIGTVEPTNTALPILTPSPLIPPSPNNCSPYTYTSGDPQNDIDVCIDFTSKTAKAGTSLTAYTYVIHSKSRLPFTGENILCKLSTTFGGIPTQSDYTNTQGYIIWSIQLPVNSTGTAEFYVDAKYLTHEAKWPENITIIP